VSAPYRDQPLSCPACSAPLRAFRTRHVCDACNGLLLTLEDLAGGIHDLTSITPTFAYRDEQPGERTCPHCRVAMTRCKLTLALEDDVAKPRPELDRCAAHGLWFDAEELAKVFEKVAGKGHGSGVGRKISERGGPATDQGRWSAMFKGRSGGWGGW